MALPHAAIHHFRHNGYLKCRDLLPAETVTELKETILKDIAEEIVAASVREAVFRIVGISLRWVPAIGELDVGAAIHEGLGCARGRDPSVAPQQRGATGCRGGEVERSSARTLDLEQERDSLIQEILSSDMQYKERVASLLKDAGIFSTMGNKNGS